MQTPIILTALWQRTAVVSEMCVFCHLADANPDQYGPFRGARQTLAHEERIRHNAKCQGLAYSCGPWRQSTNEQKTRPILR